MKLNHLDLPVPDITATQHFFETHFGFNCFYQGNGLVVLKDEVGFALTLSSRPVGREFDFPPGFHIGFIVEEEDTLRSIYAKLVASGVNIVYPLGQLGGALTFQFHAPDSVLVEVSWRS
jgi:catechol 2,3-dioxygenase-like lactoylglutathione lyase family enzyme